MAPKRSRFSQSLLDILDDLTVRRVPPSTPDDEVYALRYRAYRHEEFIQPNASKRVYDTDDTAENVYCFGIYIKQQLVSSVRLHHVKSISDVSPSRVVFPSELLRLVAKGKSYIDPSRFTTDYDARLEFPALPFLTLRVVAMACEYFKTDYCVSSVRPEHAPFYRRVFGSEKVEGALGTYPGIDFEMELHIADVRNIRDRVALRFPFFMSTFAEREALFSGHKAVGIHGLVKPTAKTAQRLESERPITQSDDQEQD